MVGTRTSIPCPNRSAVATDPITGLEAGVDQIVAPVFPSRAYTEPPLPWSVASTTSREPLPSRSDRAGDEEVLPSMCVVHARRQWVS